MQCNKCSNDIDRKREKYTVCEGKCAKRYHAACVGLSEATVQALFSKNILWMCDECLLDFCTMRDASEAKVDENTGACCSHSTTCEAEIEELKAKVNQIITTLATMEPQIKQPQQTTNETHGIVQSTPISPQPRGTHLLDGTKVCHSNSKSDCIDSDEADSFSLFITNIDPHTTDNDIIRLVCESLNINDPNDVTVRKLVSKARERDVDYFSFKVVIDNNLKQLALKPSTWPKGVKYREFENRSFSFKSLQS